MFGDGKGHEQMLEVKANILGISSDQLETQLEDNTFPGLLDEQGISHEEFQGQMHTQMEARMTEKLQQMVDDGIITDEQMQEKLEFMEQHHAEGGGPHMIGKGMHGEGTHKPMFDENGDGACDYLDNTEN